MLIASNKVEEELPEPPITSSRWIPYIFGGHQSPSTDFPNVALRHRHNSIPRVETESKGVGGSMATPLRRSSLDCRRHQLLLVLVSIVSLAPNLVFHPPICCHAGVLGPVLHAAHSSQGPRIPDSRHRGLLGA